MPQPQVPFGRRAPVGAGSRAWSPPVDQPPLERAAAPSAIVPATGPDPVEAELHQWKRERKAMPNPDIGVWRWIGVAAMLGAAAGKGALPAPLGDVVGVVLGPIGVGCLLKAVRRRRSRPAPAAADPVLPDL